MDITWNSNWLHCIHNISNTHKYTIITTITFLSFLKGYSDNDLVTNINNLIYIILP